MNEQVERNKKAAMAFYDLMFNQCQPRQAIEKYAGAAYTQHNPHVDIFRYDENGKIVEHWDVLQVVPPTSANGNTMF